MLLWLLKLKIIGCLKSELISKPLDGEDVYSLLWIKNQLLFCADQPVKHMNISQYLMSNVLTLKEFVEPSMKKQPGSALKAISSAMIFLQRYATVPFV